MPKNNQVALFFYLALLFAQQAFGNQIQSQNIEKDDQLDKLMQEIKSLDAELEMIASEVEKQSLEMKKQNSNLSRLALRLDLTKLHRKDLVDFELSFDGFDLVDFNELNDHWLALDELLVYDGPITIGEHTIDLAARFSPKTSGELYQQSPPKVKQSFKIEIVGNNNEFTLEFLQDDQSAIALLRQDKKPSL